jgi:hypothetical protein
MMKPGDLVLFVRLTFMQAWRADGLRGLPSWFAGWLTALGQWYTEGGYDGYWEIAHVGIVVEYRRVLSVLEILPGGVKLDPVQPRLCGYPGKVLVIPLADRYTSMFDPVLVSLFISKHRQDHYRWGGLPFAIVESLLGHESPGAEFCSELVIKLLSELGIIPEHLNVLRGNRIAEAHVQAQRYAPCEVARLPQYARNDSYIYGCNL